MLIFVAVTMGSKSQSTSFIIPQLGLSAPAASPESKLLSGYRFDSLNTLFTVSVRDWKQYHTRSNGCQLTAAKGMISAFSDTTKKDSFAYIYTYRDNKLAELADISRYRVIQYFYGKGRLDSIIETQGNSKSIKVLIYNLTGDLYREDIYVQGKSGRRLASYYLANYNNNKTLNRLSIVQVDSKSQDHDTLLTRQYSYDTKGRLLKQVNTVYNNSGSEITATDYRYDANGNLLDATTYNSKQVVEKAISYTYDTDNRLIKVFTADRRSQYSRSNEQLISYTAKGLVVIYTDLEYNGAQRFRNAAYYTKCK